MLSLRTLLTQGALATVVVALAATPSAAQRLAIEGIAGTSSLDLLKDPRGIGGSFLLVGTRESRISLMIVGETVRSESSGTGVVCARVIDPAECPEEPYDQVGHLSGGGIGASIRLLRLPLLEVALTPEVLFGRARTVTTGRTTDNEIAGESSELRISAGGELRLMPAPRVPVDLFVGGSLGYMGPLGSSSALEGYKPFNRWETMHRVYAGVGVRWGRALTR